jgi:Domain of unknown function (DUF4157)
MRLSPRSHEVLETFYRLHFDEPALQLPQAQIYARSIAALITKLLRVNGVTVGRWVFIRPSVTFRDKMNALHAPPELIAHELTHVVQYQKYGIAGFLLGYLKSWANTLTSGAGFGSAARMQAYLDIPHEKEARETAAAFADWFAAQKNKAETPACQTD